MPFDQVHADDVWLATLRANGRSPKTIEIYAYACGSYASGELRSVLTEIWRR